MKSKIINLFGDKPTIVQNQGVKYSKLLEQFIEPFMPDFEDMESYEEVFDFAILAWNFGNMKRILPDEESEDGINSVLSKNVDGKLLKRMIHLKVSNFKEFTNFIVDYELQETSSDPILTVSTQEQEQYLANMFEKIENENFDEENYKEDYEENYINRSAISVKPLQPFFDWYLNLFPDDDLEEIKATCSTNTYLISEEKGDVEAWLKKKFDKIFMLELDEWTSDKKEWPQQRNYKLFKQWFQIDISKDVYDLEKEPVFKG